MVKDHSDSEKGNPLPPHRLLLSINSKGSFICTIPTYRITHTTTFVTPVVEHWLEREIAQWVHPMKDRSPLLCVIQSYIYNQIILIKVTLYLRSCGVGNMVKDHSESQRGNSLPPPYRLLYSILLVPASAPRLV